MNMYLTLIHPDIHHSQVEKAPRDWPAGALQAGAGVQIPVGRTCPLFCTSHQRSTSSAFAALALTTDSQQTNNLHLGIMPLPPQ